MRSIESFDISTTRNTFYIFWEGRNRNKTIRRSNMQDSKT